MSLFLALSPGEIARLISFAADRIVLAAPGISGCVADAMLQARQKTGAAVTVIVDPNPDVCRLGYGDITGLARLMEDGVAVRKAAGLRIGILVVDGQAWAFAPTPLIVEDIPSTTEPNAIALNPSQAEATVDAIAPGWRGVEAGERREAESGGVPGIGAELVSHAELTHAEIDLRERPPTKFEVARQVMVYQSYLQFVEIKLSGCHIDRHTIQLPKQLLNIQGTPEVKARLKSQFKLVDANTLALGRPDAGGKTAAGNWTLKSIQEAQKEISRRYLKQLGEPLGNVMLKKNKVAFERDIADLKGKVEAAQTELRGSLEQEFKRSRDSLVKTFLPSIIQNPPEELVLEITREKPDEATARSYLEEILDRAIPKVDDFVKEMRVQVTFKDVTIEMLRDHDFQSQIQKHFPRVKWDELFKEEKAMKEGLPET